MTTYSKERIYAPIWLGVAITFFATQLLIQSTFVNVMGSRSAAMCLALSAAASIAGIVLAMLRGQWLSVAIAIGAAAILFVQLFTFSNISGFSVNYNILFSYSNMLALCIFSASDRKIKPALMALFFMSIIYCLIYIMKYDDFLHAASAADQLRWAKPSLASTVPEGVRVLPPDGAARSARVYLSGTFSSFAFFYSIVKLRISRNYWWLISLAISLFTIFMSGSRAYIFITLLTALIYIFYLNYRNVRIIFSIIFLIFALFMISGVPFDGFNPLAVMARDNSGASRWRAYFYIREYVATHPALGIGIAPNGEAQATLIGVPGVFWSDLGTLGVWFTFGFVGLVLFCINIVLLIIGGKRPGNVPVAEHITLILCGMAFGLSGVMSPDIWGGSSGVLNAVILGLLVRHERPALRKQPIWLGGSPVLAGMFGRRSFRRFIRKTNFDDGQAPLKDEG